MSSQDFDIFSSSGEIESELNQLVTLAELLRQRDDPGETREGFFTGLAAMIECSSDRIKEIIEPLYGHYHEMKAAQAAGPALAQGKGAV